MKARKHLKAVIEALDEFMADAEVSQSQTKIELKEIRNTVDSMIESLQDDE